MNIAGLLDDLRADEGFRDHVYDDATGQPIVKGSVVQGYPTIGYGFCVDKNKGTPLPRDIADLLLERVTQEKWSALLAALPWIAQQPEDVQRALANMAYQMGAAGVTRFGRMLAALQVGDRQQAANHALESLWARQTPKRAERVARLLRG